MGRRPVSVPYPFTVEPVAPQACCFLHRHGSSLRGVQNGGHITQPMGYVPKYDSLPSSAFTKHPDLVHESTDWGADDVVLEEWRLKNALGRAERTHKSQTAP